MNPRYPKEKRNCRKKLLLFAQACLLSLFSMVLSCSGDAHQPPARGSALNLPAKRTNPLRKKSGDLSYQQSRAWLLRRSLPFEAGEVPEAALKPFQFNLKFNPFYLRGDLNAGGTADIAFAVTHMGNGKGGILIYFTEDKSIHLLGAGTAFHGSDDLGGFDTWKIIPQMPGPESDYFNPGLAGKFKGAFLYIEKLESASAFIGWDGRQFVWVQHGD